MDPFIGMIVLFGGNFAPRSWAYCEGQLLSINSNSALFSILGTTYGGDGRTTFGLPNLKGKVAIHPGKSPGGSVNFVRGNGAGSDTVTLTTLNMPQHNHSLSGTATLTGAATARLAVNEGTSPDSSTIVNHYISSQPVDVFNTTATTGKFSGPGPVDLSGVTVGGSTGMTGNNQPFYIVQPFCVINYIIALQGLFPSRN